MKLEQDKLLHIAVGAAMGAIGYAASLYLKLPEVASFGALAACAAGFAKEELYDLRRLDRHTYDGWDAYWTAAGGWMGVLMAMLGHTLFLLYGIVIQ